MIRLTSGAIRRAVAHMIEPSRRVALPIPDVEAPDVELESLVRPRADGFHEELVAADALPAGIAFLPVGDPAPKARDAVLGQLAGHKLATND